MHPSQIDKSKLLQNHSYDNLCKCFMISSVFDLAADLRGQIGIVLAQEELQERGLEQASIPPHANQLARPPSGTLSQTLPFCPESVPQAFLSTSWKISLKM